MDKIIGIDIGGTKISLVVGTSRGRIIAKQVIKTQHRKKVQACLDELILATKKMKSEHVKKDDRFLGIGICIPGPIGDDPYVITGAPNLPGWNGLNIGKIFKERFRCRVCTNNDANAACLAEKLFGHGRDYSDFVYVTISTGIGAGIIVQERLLMGRSNSAGELGHCVVEPAGPMCNCGKKGCLEAVASGTAIAQFATAIRDGVLDHKEVTTEAAYRRFRLFPEYKNFQLKKKTLIRKHSGLLTARDVASYASDGDEIAQYIYFRAGYYCGIGLSYIIQLINPGMITLGGSVIRSGSLYFPPMRLALKEYAWPRPYRACTIIPAKLGDSVGDLGAIGLCCQ